MAGEQENEKIEKILKEFNDKVDCIVDEGDLKKAVPSTIIKIEENNIKILREGPIDREEIERRIKE